MDDYLITAEVIDDAISISVELEHEIVLNLFEYPAEITVLSNKITDVEAVALAATATADAATTTAASAQSSADAAMSQAEAATDIAASNTLTISNILSNFTAWVLGTHLGALTLLDVAIAAGESIQVMAGKLQGQVNAIKVRLGLLENSASFYTQRLNQTLTGSILLDRDVTQYSSLTLTGNLELSVAAIPTPVMEATAEGVIVGDGTSLLTLNGITYWATSPEFDKSVGKQNHFMVWKQGSGIYIFITQKN